MIGLKVSTYRVPSQSPITVEGSNNVYDIKCCQISDLGGCQIEGEGCDELRRVEGRIDGANHR